ncbi:MAG: hypothetical protein QNK04_15730 [Myxococcota bacterium]|nr:hypothetical protein [Myxococcota bacterium]
MSRRPLRGLTLGLTLLLGCAGIGASEIPERSIAVYWYDVETERRRAEAIEAMGPTGGSRSGGGIADLADVSRYVSGLFTGDFSRGSEESLEARFPGQLALLDPRSEAVTPLDGALPGALPVAWSPDGRLLMYSQPDGRFRQLFELDTRDGTVRRLTRGPGVHTDGCYLPGGRYVFARAEVRTDRVVTSIQLTEPGGVAPRTISSSPTAYGPDCAPDGRAIAWVDAGVRGRDSLVVRMPAVEGSNRLLGPGRHPSFSASGEWIVYTAPVKRKWSLYRVRADGSGRKSVGTSTLDELQPSLSPDGKLVVYVADDGFHRRFYLRRFDGTGDRVLLTSGGGEYPVW